jgi:hypothetical protein
MLVQQRGIEICIYGANSPKPLCRQHLASVGAHPGASNTSFHSAKRDRFRCVCAVGENEEALHEFHYLVVNNSAMIAVLITRLRPRVRFRRCLIRAVDMLRDSQEIKISAHVLSDRRPMASQNLTD